jgi:large exoprotein involved in heme utilization and adhesion
VKADSLLIDGSAGPAFFTGILADAEPGGTGSGGNVAVQVRDLRITGGGEIGSLTFGPGNAGSVDVKADSLLIDGSAGPDLLTGISADAVLGSNGNGGNVTVQAVDATITAGGLIEASTYGNGNGGNVNVSANSLFIDGAGSPFFTGISAGALGSGNGGDVAVLAQALSIVGGGQIAAATFSSGRGGNVTIHAGSLSIDGSAAPDFFTGVSAATQGSGDAGNVSVTVDDTLGLFGGGQISAASSTSAAAGSVQLRLGTLSMDSDSSISSANTGTGSAGDVTINTTAAVTVKHGSTISTASVLGDAGDIELTSGGEIKLKDQSSITASAGLNGGDITISAPGQLVYLVDSSITATAGSTGSSGIGGNITIDHPQFIVASNSLISANATVGTAGNVYLNPDFLFTSNSTVLATGTINITAPALDLGAQLITLPSSLLSAENQLQERCTALLRGDFSSFISIGRGGTEPAPEELQEEF